MEDLVKIGERLRKVLHEKKMNVNELGRKSGTKGTQIYNIVKGKKFGVDKFIGIVRVLPDINVNWLLLGEGNMYRSKAETQQEEKKQTEKQHQKNDPEKDKLQKEVESLKSTIAYQEMTIDAYKRAMEVATASNEDLKRILEFYREKAEYGTGNEEKRNSA